eukprot:1711239-Lingulodinium_polyedra.AAC.1
MASKVEAAPNTTLMFIVEHNGGHHVVDAAREVVGDCDVLHAFRLLHNVAQCNGPSSAFRLLALGVSMRHGWRGGRGGTNTGGWRNEGKAE